MINVMALAQYILCMCMNQGEPISNLQLQKILYFIQGNHLAKKGEPLFDADFDAWKYGPVIPDIYYEYCMNGASKIRNVEALEEISPEIKDEIDPIIQKLRVLYPWDLVEKTHNVGGAWDKTFQDGKGERHRIPKEAIKEEFNNKK